MTALMETTRNSNKSQAINRRSIHFNIGIIAESGVFFDVGRSIDDNYYSANMMIHRFD